MIRKALQADARRIAKIHVAAWQAAYKGQIPQMVLDGLSVEARTLQWEGILSRDESTTLLAESAGAIVGFVNVGRTHDADQNPTTTGEIFAIYIDPPAQRRGHGRQLFDAAKAILCKLGMKQFTLWVLRKNTAAQGFYSHLGMTPDGTSKTDDRGSVPLDEVRYHGVLSTQ